LRIAVRAGAKPGEQRGLTGLLLVPVDDAADDPHQATTLAAASAAAMTAMTLTALLLAPRGREMSAFGTPFVFSH
jgi:hypothetical protein